MGQNLTAILIFAAGVIVGLVLMWLHLKGHQARADQETKRVRELEGQIADFVRERSRLEVAVAELKKEREADEAKARWVETAEQALREAFQALAANVLQTNAEDFLRQASTQFGTLVTPLGKTLEDLESHVRDLETKREGAYQGLNTQLQQLSTTTTTLGQALRSSSARGRWGEIQLRRLVELAGMVEHIDFQEQAAIEAGRPDLLVNLPNGGVLPVDAKTPMQAYLEASEVTEEATRAAKLDLHAKALRQHVKHLAEKQYWRQFERAPEVVIMFVPNEACLGAAFEREPHLLEEAIQQRVLLATPVTLLALLMSVAYGWQQHQVAENAREIAQHGRQLHGRILDFFARFAGLGRRLDQTVKSYNDAIGSLESRVVPTARRFRELGLSTEDVPVLLTVDQIPRMPAMTEADKDESRLAPGPEVMADGKVGS